MDCELAPLYISLEDNLADSSSEPNPSEGYSMSLAAWRRIAFRTLAKMK